MTSNEPIINLESKLDEAVAKSDTRVLKAAVDHATKMIVIAVQQQSFVQLSFIVKLLGSTFQKFALLYDWKTTSSLEREAWKMVGIAKTAHLFSEFVPQEKNIEISDSDKSRRTDVLLSLRNINTSGLSNTEIHEKTNARLETVSRVLKNLESEGLVTSWKRGRRRVNKLTPSGIIAANRLAPTLLQDGSVFTTLAEKINEDEPPHSYQKELGLGCV